MEAEVREIGGVGYQLKMIPAMAALKIISRLETEGITPEVIFDVISKGAQVGSVGIDQKKFDKQFAGKLKDCMELFAEVLKYNNMVPEVEEGNAEGSAE